MSVCEAAARRLVLGAFVLCSLCQQLRGQETSPTGLILTLQEMGRNDGVSLGVEQTRNISLVPGLSYVINCNGQGGFGGATAVWYRNGVTVTDRTGQRVDQSVSSVHAERVDGNNWRLVLQRFMDAGSTGSYVCRGMNGEVTLVIGTSNPTVIAATPLRLIRQGAQSVNRPVLTAFVSGTPTPSTENITWYFNNGSLPEGVLQGGHEVVFPSFISSSFSGVYTVRVTTSRGTATDHFEVIITSQPIPTITPGEKQTQRNGTSITLICEDGEGVPAPDLSWEHDGVQLQNESGRITITKGVRRVMDADTSNSTLTIHSLLPGDSGTYECVSVNTRGSSTDSVDIDVLFKPILIAFSSQLRRVVGSTAVLRTILDSANPTTDISVQWFHPSGGLISSDQYGTSVDINGSTVYEVTLRSLSESDGGMYTCVVSNSIGSSRLTFELVITVPPILQHTDGSTGIRTVLGRDMATQLMLSAKILRANPPVTSDQVSWRKNNTSIMDNPDYITTATPTRANLTIITLNMDNTALYTVTVMHEAGNASLQFWLIVFDRPPRPTILSATPVSACMADIVWTIPLPSPTEAVPSYIQFEVFLVGSSITWVEIGRVYMAPSTQLQQRTSFRGIIPPGGVNTSYYLRARSVNDSIGESDIYQAPDTFTVYMEAFFPSLTEVSGEASNDSYTLTVRWTLPPHDCFNLSTFNISCMSLEARGQNASNRVSGALGHALVNGLTPDTFYNCSVESSFEGFSVTSLLFTMRPIFTFPPEPAAPGKPSVADTETTSSTVTVEFTLPADHQNISHYRVYVVRLSEKDMIPGTHPDELFRDDSQISTYKAVNEPDPFEGKTVRYLAYITAEMDATQFKPRFTIGNGMQTDRKEQFPNSGLHANSIYTFFLRAYPKTRGDFLSSRDRRQASGASSRQYVVFSSSIFSPIATTGEPESMGNSPATTDIAVGVVVGIFLFLIVLTVAIIVILYLALRCANSRSFKPDRFPSVENSPSMSYTTTPDGASMIDTPDLTRKVNGGHELKILNGQFHARSPFVPRGVLKREQFASHVEEFDSNRQLLFQEEYEYISQNSPWNPAEASNHILNDEKNRYSNITAFDHSRVELMPIDGIECSDYINANYISGYHSEQEYIATQGPLEQTVEDFWRMVWEQQTATIVMLTNIVELGKIKCAQYWPQTGKLIYGNLKVTLENTVELPDYTIRDLSVENLVSGDVRTVLQFHYTRWPDYGTPQLAAPLLNFLRALNSSNPFGAGPMVVHCSAGVGRSGTVIALNYCLHRLKDEGLIDVCNFVSRMRQQRNYMVQTEQQYAFIHFAILECITYGDTSSPLTDFTSLYEKLQVVNPKSNKAMIDEEYSRLGQVKTMVKRSAFQKRLKRKGEPPRHFESSFRGAVGTMESSDNYSGHFVDSYFEKRRYIVAEGPQESTTAKFWQVVWDEDCSFVVMLTPQDSPLLYPYWPLEGEQVQHGNVIVQVEKESQEHLYTKREIKLTNAKVDAISHKLIQYQFMGWMENNFPRVPDFVKFVCDVLSGVRNMKGNKKVLMHDTDSLGPAGIMCALCYCIDRLGTERMVDIFQAVQSIQLQRPGSIKTMTQYAFTYDCVYEYIRTYSSSP